MVQNIAHFFNYIKIKRNFIILSLLTKKKIRKLRFCALFCVERSYYLDLFSVNKGKD